MSVAKLKISAWRFIVPAIFCPLCVVTVKELHSPAWLWAIGTKNLFSNTIGISNTTVFKYNRETGKFIQSGD